MTRKSWVEEERERERERELERNEVRKDMANLRGFARYLLSEDDINGFDLHDAGVKYGLLTPTEVTGPCEQLHRACRCEELGDFPTTCYRWSNILMSVPPRGDRGRRSAGLTGEGDPMTRPDAVTVLAMVAAMTRPDAVTVLALVAALNDMAGVRSDGDAKVCVDAAAALSALLEYATQRSIDLVLLKHRLHQREAEDAADILKHLTADTRAYLGDGVYIDLESDGGVVLTAENGIQLQHTIYLEPEVLRAFDLYRERFFPKLRHIEE